MIQYCFYSIIGQVRNFDTNARDMFKCVFTHLAMDPSFTILNVHLTVAVITSNTYNNVAIPKDY